MELAPGTRLQVFVSSPSNLVDYREAAREAVSQLGLKPVMFEDWGARDAPMRTTYLREVRSSQAYLGLFDAEWSSPTAEEFVEATKAKLPRFVYVAERSRKEDDPRLTTFLGEISNPQEGLVYKKFGNSSQLRKQIVDDLIEYLCETAIRVQTIGPLPTLPETVAEQVPAPRCDAFESEVTPDEIRAGETLILRVRFSGVLTSGLLSAMLVHRESAIQFWAPNTDTWVPYLDTGTLNGPMRAREWEWKADIPPWIPPGHLVVSPGVWEDPTGIPSRRRHVAVGKHEVTVKESTDTIVVHLNRLFRLFLGRDSDVMGLKSWYDLISTERTPMGRILVDGFLKSVEFRVEQLHNAFGIDAPAEDRHRWTLSIQQATGSLEELITHLYSVAVAARALPSDQGAAARRVSASLGVPIDTQTLKRLEEAALAAHKDLLPVALIRALNDETFLVAQVLRTRDPNGKVDASEVSVEAARLKSAKDPSDFLWRLWTGEPPP